MANSEQRVTSRVSVRPSSIRHSLYGDERPRTSFVPGGEQVKEVAWRLVVLGGRCGFEKLIATKIVTNEEGVHPGDRAADDAITFFATQPHQGFEACSVEIGAVPASLRIVRNRQRERRS